MAKTIYIEGTAGQLEDIAGELADDYETKIGDISIVMVEIDEGDAADGGYPNARIQDDST